MYVHLLLAGLNVQPANSILRNKDDLHVHLGLALLTVQLGFIRFTCTPWTCLACCATRFYFLYVLCYTLRSILEYLIRAEQSGQMKEASKSRQGRLSSGESAFMEHPLFPLVKGGDTCQKPFTADDREEAFSVDEEEGHCEIMSISSDTDGGGDGGEAKSKVEALGSLDGPAR